MKTWRDEASPWGQRVHFEAHEFESMMDELLHRAGEDVFVEGTGVNADQVLLRALALEADYVDLPDGVMGRTLFRGDGRAEIQVSRALADAAEDNQTARRRLRTTLGHETGHVACHQHLFVADTETIDLFALRDRDASRHAVLCREGAVGRMRYHGHWWEYQANQCMAALLLPRWLLGPRVDAVLRAHDLPSFAEAIRTGVAGELIQELCDQFDVSQEAMFYRLQAFGHVPNVAQPELALES